MNRAMAAMALVLAACGGASPVAAESRGLGRCDKPSFPANFDQRSDAAWAAVLNGTPDVGMAVLAPGFSSELRDFLSEGDAPSVCVLGFNALTLAISHDDREALELLLQAGAHPDRPLNADSTTPLSMALVLGKFDVAARLLEHGASARHLSDAGLSPLHDLALGEPGSEAALRAQAALARTLVAGGAAINGATTVHRFTPLMLAAREGHAALVEALIREGASVNLRNAQGQTALDLARAKRHAAIVDGLIRAGARP